MATEPTREEMAEEIARLRAQIGQVDVTPFGASFRRLLCKACGQSYDTVELATEKQVITEWFERRYGSNGAAR